MNINIKFILTQLLIRFLYWIFTSVLVNLATNFNNMFFIVFLCCLFLGSSILFHKKRSKKNVLIADCLIVLTFIFLNYILR